MTIYPALRGRVACGPGQTLRGFSVLSHNCSVTLGNWLNPVEAQLLLLLLFLVCEWPSLQSLWQLIFIIYSSFIPLLPLFEQIPNFAQVFPTPNSIEDSWFISSSTYSLWHLLLIQEGHVVPVGLIRLGEVFYCQNDILPKVINRFKWNLSNYQWHFSQD